jgi:hypothetical protein
VYFFLGNNGRHTFQSTDFFFGVVVRFFSRFFPLSFFHLKKILFTAILSSIVGTRHYC